MDIILLPDGSPCYVANGVDIQEEAIKLGGTVISLDDYVPIDKPPTFEEQANDEANWRAEALKLTARQLEAIEEDEAGVTPQDLLSGTRKQWLKYRGQVSNWSDTNADFPDSTKRPVQPA